MYSSPVLPGARRRHSLPERMEKDDPLPTVNYRVKGETFEQALAKCPMHCYRKV
jgi:hypothetical protein